MIRTVSTVRLFTPLPSDTRIVSIAGRFSLLTRARLTHASPDARVAVRADSVGADVEITVEDSGPGVAPDALPRLFDRFYRAPRLSASRHGVGLGLTVVRGLVEAMGGSVRATASELGGLAIVIRVPAAPAMTEPR